MKLWPFSKKPGNPVSDSKFELPPGVMLAAPDEDPMPSQAAPAVGRYDAMHSEEEKQPVELEPSLSSTMPEELKSDLPQFAAQNQLEFLSSPVSSLADAQPLPLQSAQPQPAQDTDPLAFLNGGATSETLMQPGLQSVMPPIDAARSDAVTTEAANFQKQPASKPLIDFGLSANYTPSTSMAPKVQHRVEKSVETVEEAASEDFLYMPGIPAAHKAPDEPLMDLSLLAPPPVAPALEPIENLSSSAQESSSMVTDFESSMFNVPASDPFLLVAEEMPTAESVVCDLSSDLAAPLLADSLSDPFNRPISPIGDLDFTPNHLEEMATFLAEAEEDALSFDLSATSELDPKGTLPEAHLSAFAEQSVSTAENHVHLAQVEMSQLAEAPMPALEESEAGFFSTASFESMGDMGGDMGFFAEPDALFYSEEAIASSAYNPALYNQDDTQNASFESQSSLRPDIFRQEASADSYEYNADLMAASEYSAYEEENDYRYNEPDELALSTDFGSYDLGHYDDPDQPTEPFVLGEPELAEPKSDFAEPEPAIADLKSLAYFLESVPSEQSLSEACPQEDVPWFAEEIAPVAEMLPVVEIAPVIEMAPKPERAIPLEAFSVETFSPKMELITPKPITQEPSPTKMVPKPERVIPLETFSVETFSAKTESVMPEPITPELMIKEPSPTEMPLPIIRKSAPQPPQLPLLQKPKKSAPKGYVAKPLPRPKFYTDSITQALEEFQEEMLLEDSRFIRNSINNLVDRYFSQQEPESSW